LTTQGHIVARASLKRSKMNGNKCAGDSFT
jgi:hypothetical protein